MLIPVLPDIQKEIGISAFQASLIITAYAAVAIFFIPLAGYLSDVIGRKKVILPGLIVVAAAGAFSGWASVALTKPYATDAGCKYPLGGDIIVAEWGG